MANSTFSAQTPYWEPAYDQFDEDHFVTQLFVDGKIEEFCRLVATHGINYDLLPQKFQVLVEMMEEHMLDNLNQYKEEPHYDE